MFQHICSTCGSTFTTEIPWNRDVKEICFPCAMDELEREEEDDE